MLTTGGFGRARFKVRALAGSVATTLTAASLVSLGVVSQIALAPPAHAGPASAVTEYQPTLNATNSGAPGDGGKWGGRSVAVDVNPANPSTVMTATESGGLFRSTDGGANWTHVDTLVPFRMADLKWASNNPSVVLATTWQTGDSANPGGIYRSTDGGLTWSHATVPGCGGASGDYFAWGIAFEPSSSNAYAGTDCGLAWSTDQGATWNLQAMERVHAVAASTGGIVDMCTGSGHRRSTVTGGTIAAVGGLDPIPGAGGGGCPFPNIGASAHDMAVSPQESNVLFVLRGAVASGCGAGNPNILYESDDAGVTWTQVGGGCTSRAPWVATHASASGSATQFDVYYSGGLDLYRGTCTSGGPGLRCSGLPSIGAPNVPTAHPDINGISFAPDATNCANFLVVDGGVEKGSSCGASFVFTAGSGGNGGYNALQLYEVNGQSHPGCTPASSSTCQTDLYVGTQDNDNWASPDAGATWPTAGCCEGFSFQTPPTAPNDSGQQVSFITCAGCGNKLAASRFAGCGYNPACSGWNNPPGTVPGPETMTPYLLRGSATNYVQWSIPSGTTNQLYKSPDTGGTWTAVNAATISQALMGRAAVAGPASDPTIYQPYCINNCGFIAPSGGLDKVTGIGLATATVTDVTSGLGALGTWNFGNGSWLIQESALGVDPSNPLHLIAADVASRSMKVSTDGGATWKVDNALTNLVTRGGQLAFSIPSVGTEAHAIAFDPANGNRILVGTESAGVIASVNGGATWTKLVGSEKLTAASSFFFDQANGTIYASSYGRGLWKVTIPTADLSITKTHSPDPATAGTQLTWTITVTNNGPDAVLDAVVTDTLPAQVTYLSNNLNPPASCSVVGQSVTCQVGQLNSGQSISFQIVTFVHPDAVVGSGGAASITNVATVSSLSVADPNPSNNTASDTAILNDSADLGVTKICTPNTNVYAGTPINCTVYVDNLGPSYARGVVVDDTTLSNGAFTISNVAVSPGPTTCTQNPVSGGTDLRCTLGALANASTTTTGRDTLTYTISANDGQNINNTAVVRSDTPDPNGANNQASVNLSVTSVANLGLTKIGPASVVAGTAIEWTLRVHNAGPSVASSNVITDTVPAGVSITSVAMPGGSCTAGVPGDPTHPTVCTFGPLASGADSATMTVDAVVLPTTTGILHNDASVTSATFDNNTNDNLAHTDTSVTVVSSLTVAIVPTPNVVTAGTPLSYQITVGNGGPSTATGITLTDPLPSGVMFSSTGGVGNCSYQTNTATVSCQLPNLDPGQSEVVTIYTTVKTSTLPGQMSNTATATGSGSPAASGTATVTVQTRADLSIVLTSDQTVYHPSTTIHYQITVTNLGPSDAQNVVIVQNLPTVKQGKYVSNSLGCPAPTGTTLTCQAPAVPALATIPAGGSITFQVNFYITGNKGTITSSASVSSATTDPLTANNSSTRNVTVK